MTTDTQLAPTDAEIAALYAEQTGFILDDSPAALLDFARAVLARWGQPAHSGEPVGYLYCGGSYGEELADWEIVAEQSQCDRLNEHHGALGKEAKLPLYTTPQPVERDPLPDSWIRSMCAQPWVFDTVKQWVRITEAAHGIKGGQHGNE